MLLSEQEERERNILKEIQDSKTIPMPEVDYRRLQELNNKKFRHAGSPHRRRGQNFNYMYKRREFLNNLWRWKCGHPEADQTPKNRGITVSELAETEWSPEFEQLMRNRLVFGAYRYGRMVHGGGDRKGKPVYDRTESIRKRLKRFELTGNAEWLVDIANMALLMYEERQHPEFHLGHVDGDSEESYHDKIIK